MTIRAFSIPRRFAATAASAVIAMAAILEVALALASASALALDSASSWPSSCPSRTMAAFGTSQTFCAFRVSDGGGSNRRRHMHAPDVYGQKVTGVEVGRRSRMDVLRLRDNAGHGHGHGHGHGGAHSLTSMPSSSSSSSTSSASVDAPTHPSSTKREGGPAAAAAAAARKGGGGGFIDTELRGAAMRLHTTKQSPKEGKVVERDETNKEPYVPTHDDYLRFLVDSKAVYDAFERDVLPSIPQMRPFCGTKLERGDALERDIRFMVDTYGLTRPDVGEMGASYANEIRRVAQEGTVPELVCHYYNYYFAHTAGGRMIGNQMAALLLDKKTLDFYKWDGDLNEIKSKVKDDIEAMAARWTQEEKDQCVGATAAAFRGGGGLNSYLNGGKSNPH